MQKVTKTMDGNQAAAYASYNFTEVAAIYPITPSTPMAEGLMNGLLTERKICLISQLRLLKCNPKLVQLAQYTDHFKLVH